MSFSQYPQNPVIGQEYTVGTMVVTWDGTKFVSVVEQAPSLDQINTALAELDDGLTKLNSQELLAQINRKSTLDLRFNENQHRVYEPFGLTDKLLTDAITTTRASTATYNSPFGIATAAATIPRIEYEPETGECLGLLCEEQRTNLLLNSETPATQSATVTAQAYTLSFYGVGSVQLSGVAANILTGADEGRVSITFTPTAGVLTVTPSGGPVKWQLEAGSFPTSYIKTEGSQVTRAVDFSTVSINPAIINRTIFVEIPNVAAGQAILTVNRGGATSVPRIGLSAGNFQLIPDPGGVLINHTLNLADGNRHKIAISIKPGTYRLAVDGVIVVSSASTALISALTTITLGRLAWSSTQGNVLFNRAFELPRALSEDDLIELTRL